MLNNKDAPMNDTTNTCSCDCGVRATVPSETTVSRESRHDSKQLCNSERNQSDRDARASATFNGVVSAAVPHVPDVRTIPDSVSALSTRHKQQARRTTQRWDPTVCQDTADDNDNDTSCQMPAPCQESPSQKKKKKTSWVVPSTDVIVVTRKKSKKLTKKKNSQAALLGLMRRQHSKPPPAVIVATFVPRQTPGRRTSPSARLSRDRAGAAGRDPSTSECEWPILEPTRRRCATLSTPTELKRKITTIFCPPRRPGLRG